MPPDPLHATVPSHNLLRACRAQRRPLYQRDDLPGFPLAIHVYPDDHHVRRAGKVDLSASGALLTRLKFCIAFETSC